MQRAPKRHRATAIAYMARLGLVLLLGILIGACERNSASADAVTLDELVRFAERYDGERVSASGTVHTHPEPEHYWIEDDKLNRVAIEPDAAVKDLVGEAIRVEGAFHYSRDTGRIIEVETVTLTP